MKRRLEKKHHALIVVAEGAGQNLFDDKTIEKDASGNIKYNDIGVYLRDTIKTEFKIQDFRFNMKYIDPSYIIRSSPANANDSLFCNILAQNAVHAAMSGKTGFVVGYWNTHFTVLPIPMAVEKRKKISTEGELWSNVIETTGQPKKLS